MTRRPARMGDCAIGRDARHGDRGKVERVAGRPKTPRRLSQSVFPDRLRGTEEDATCSREASSMMANSSSREWMSILR